MFRMTVSFCALFGSMLFISKLIVETNAQERTTFPPNALREPVGRYKSDVKVQSSTKSTKTEKATVKSVLDTTTQGSTEVQLSTEKKTPVGKAGKAQTDKAQNGNAKTDKAHTANAKTPKTKTDRVEKLTAKQLKLKQDLRQTLAHYYFRPSSIDDHSPWGIMHCLIAYGVDTNIVVRGRKLNAIGWLCWNGESYGLQLFYTQNGELQTRRGPGVQGHDGQFLSMLAQSRVPRDYKLRVDGQTFTVMDLVRHEQKTCHAGTELTFKLIGLVHYLKSDAKWKNEYGEDWSIPRLIQEELKQPVVGAACGGTHRMMGFSYAVRKREKRKEPFTGQWLRAKKYVDAYHKYTFKLQNENGTFSSNFFASRGDWGGPARRLETTGHTLEWLVYSLPKSQLDDPRVVKAVRYLNDLLWKNRQMKWGIGPKGHALHALALYDERRFGGEPGKRASQLRAALIAAKKDRATR